MKKIKRYISLLLAMCLCWTILPAVKIQVDATDSVGMMVSYAQARVGKSGQELCYNDQWCAYFVSDCAIYAGQSKAVPYNGNAHWLYWAVLEAGGKVVSSPKSGDLVFYSCTHSSCDDGDGIAMQHVGLVENENYTIEGNLDGSSFSTSTVKRKGINASYSHGSGHSTANYVKRVFVRPNYTNNTIKHTVDTTYGTNLTAYPKAKITAGNILDEYHNQIDSTSWIGTSDKCTIHEVYTDGCCKVTYPLDAGGTKTVYSKISLFNIHKHSYTGYRYHESAHPHAIWQKCVDYETCGGWIYTGDYYEKNTCEQCWYADFDIGASSVSVKVGESKTVSASLSGCLPDSAVLDRKFSPDNDVVEVTIKNQQAIFTGLKAGTTDFSLTLYSDSSKSHIIATITIPVTVTNKTYAVSYNANGGSGAPGSQTKYHNTTLTLSNTKPTRTGYTFLGWSTSSTATSATYKPGGSFTSNTNTTLYAVWKKGCEGDNHKYAYNVTGIPTLSSTGKIVGECGRCGETTSVLLPKLNTNDYNYKETKAATCTDTGMGRYTWKTTSYGGSYYFDEAIPAAGHSYSSKITAPTCTSQGFTTHTCFCGHSYKDSYTGATGHSYGIWHTRNSATCMTNGEEYRICTKCEDEEVRVIPAVGHHLGFDNVCDNCGYGEYTVSYNANGGTGAPKGQIKYHNKTLILSNTKPICTGYTFLGWSVHKDALVADYLPGDTFKANANATLYAVWKANFADISTNSWQFVAVNYAVEKNLMAGKGKNASGSIIFDPNSPISREEFVQVLYNAEGKPSVSFAKDFPDVKDNSWYKNAVLWAFEKNIASGMGNGNFGVGKNITRQDLAMMLYKYAKLKGCSLDAEAGKINGFTDGNKVADYAKTAMDWAVTNGILSGKGETGKPLSTFKLDPTGTATRAECAAMLRNFMTAFGL